MWSEAAEKREKTFSTDRSLTVLCFICSHREGDQMWAGGHTAQAASAPTAELWRFKESGDGAEVI